jgi:hypothetical protein
MLFEPFATGVLLRTQTAPNPCPLTDPKGVRDRHLFDFLWWLIGGIFEFLRGLEKRF